MKKLIVITIVLLLTLTSCGIGDKDVLANGENYYCPNKSYLDVIQTAPELQVRFTCTNRSFEIVFEGPNETELIQTIRAKNEMSWGLGVILREGKIIQLYEVTLDGKVITHWRAPDDK